MFKIFHVFLIIKEFTYFLNSFNLLFRIYKYMYT